MQFKALSVVMSFQDLTKINIIICMAYFTPNEHLFSFFQVTGVFLVRKYRILFSMRIHQFRQCTGIILTTPDDINANPIILNNTVYRNN